jgi:hypothetical protein
VDVVAFLARIRLGDLMKNEPGGIAYNRKPPSRRVKETSIPSFAPTSALAKPNECKGSHGAWRWNCFQYEGRRQINLVSSTKLEDQTDSHGVTHSYGWLGWNGLSKRFARNRRDIVRSRSHLKRCIQ